ncbi:MAG: hypothetical protein ACT4O5_10130 [Gammaproteobacteria bacterium]
MTELRVLFALLVAALCGCATYTTPGGAASIPAITEAGIAEALARRPAASFPARLIMARVQASGYQSYSNQGYGSGRYSVLTNRDIETESDFARLRAMPGVAGVGPLNRVLLPTRLETAQELRAAAAQLRGDIVLLYTFDTSFRTDTQRLAALQAVSLGFFPGNKSFVTATCAAAFIDVRTGFVYGVAEATATESQRSDHWRTRSAIEKARLTAEREAFTSALGEIEKTWAAIHAEHAGAR